MAHILNLVGGDLLSSQILADVKKLQTLVRSFIKGKKNVSRRCRLTKIAKISPTGSLPNTVEQLVQKCPMDE